MSQTKIDMTDGLSFSRIVAGMMNLAQWQLSTDDLITWLEAAIEMGITTFDHADIYGSYTCEGLFGQALQQQPNLRNKMQLVTKCDIMLTSENRPDNIVNHYNTSRAHIIASVENSLIELKTSYIDLLLIHRPDALMDADEVAEALTALKDAGKVRFFGVSNHSPSQFRLLQSRLDFPLITNQVEFSVAHLQPLNDGTFDQCQELRIAPMIWSPLAGGRIFWGEDEQSKRLQDTLGQLGEKYNAGVDQIALAWTMRHPVNVLPVLGTGKLERYEAALAATDIELTRQEWYSVWVASMGYNVP